ncbi:hypothetical protein [Paenibacillus polymyxa]|uniref:hypothetical protein n=1 Tax=Paenibacillus polymyxa TaxID=1406 RepID=UPI000F4FA0B8|nr:hypothetical protein [Paenibacillus polymyxa]URJ67419.3 hypothetical protein MF620_002387 [Paenibacillus polymyxa]
MIQSLCSSLPIRKLVISLDKPLSWMANAICNNHIRLCLTNSYELDDNQVEETMLLDLPHRNDTDGSYLALIKVVNRRCPTEESARF